MKRRMRDLFTVVLRTSDGRKVRGEFGDPNASPRPRKEITNLPHRLVTISRLSPITAGDVVSYAGVDYILCGQHILRDFARYLAIEVNQRYEWSRPREAKDPVTGLIRDQLPELLHPSLPVCIEPMSFIEEQRFEVPSYRVFSGAALAPGDTLGTLRVMNVTQVFGVTMADVA